MGSRRHVEQIKNGPPLSPDVDIRAHSKEYAESLDAQDPLRKLRNEFIIPSKADLKRPTLSSTDAQGPSPPSIYLCGNSLGLQPRRTKDRISLFLTAWSTKVVTGHFRNHSDSSLPSFVDADDYAAKLMAPIVGAREDEIAVMGTLTSNLHLLMSSFYRPTKEKYKIILEGKSFPSDHVCSFPIQYMCCPIFSVVIYLDSNSKLMYPFIYVVRRGVADLAARLRRQRSHDHDRATRFQSHSHNRTDPGNNRHARRHHCLDTTTRCPILHRPVSRHHNHYPSRSLGRDPNRLGLCARSRKCGVETA
jgi:hypothetical protein